MSEECLVRPLSRRSFMRLSLLTGAASLLAACQQATPAAPTAAPAKPAAAPTTAPAAAKPAAQPANAVGVPSKAGGQPAPTVKPAAQAARTQLQEWTIAMSEDITGLDPGVETGGSIHWNVKFHMFEPLIGYEGPDLKPVPRLAESWRYLDDTTLEMKLRQGVKFHNGDDFTADDVLYTFEVHRNEPKLGSGYVFDPVTKLEKIDAHTIRWTMERPVAAFLPFTGQVFLVMPKVRETMGAEAFGKRPIGTGMYRLNEEFARDKPIKLVANEAYWGGPANPPRLQFRFIREPSTRVAELQNGTVQVTQNIPLPQVELLKRNPKTDVTSLPAARIMYQSINLSKEPFTNVKVRQAMNYAINREVITKNVLQGYGQPFVGLYAPGFIGHNPSQVTPYSHDLAKAKQLLAEAGLPNGFEFEWQTTDGVFLKDREIAEAVAAMLKQAGITANIRILERATIYDNVFSGNFDVVAGQWGGNVDPARYLQWIFVRTGGVNEAKEADPIRVLMEQGESTVDPEKRAQVYQEISQRAYSDAMLLFIHLQDELFGVDKQAEWTPYPVRGSATQHWYALHPSLTR